MSKTTAPCPCLSVTPAYSEEATRADVVRKVLKPEHLLEVVVVGDSSSDRTGAVARALAADDARAARVRSGRGASL